MYPAALLTLFELAKLSIDDLTSRLQRGEISVDEWHDGMLHAVTKYALLAMMLGLGTDELTAEAEQAVADYVESQTTYLDGFVGDIRASPEWNGSWNVRAEMYGEATQQMYWRGATRLLRLPAYPGDCSSECMTSDRCMWMLDWLDEVNLDVDAYWVDLKDSKVCPTCAERAVKWNPLRVRNGVVPRV